MYQHIPSFLIILSLLSSTVLCSWTWSNVGVKVAHHSPSAAPRTGSIDVLIGYAGWNISLGQSQLWNPALYGSISGKIKNKITDVYAVGGPASPDYHEREIGNSKLIADLKSRLKAYHAQGVSLGTVHVMGHSSGSFVAHEFLAELTYLDPGRAIAGHVHYYNLDGGQAGLTVGIVRNVTRHCTFCYGYDKATGTYSPNMSGMKALQQTMQSTKMTSLYQHDASKSQCNKGANWCLHMTMITEVPWNHNAATGWLDYTDFKPPHVIATDYFDK